MAKSNKEYKKSSNIKILIHCKFKKYSSNKLKKDKNCTETNSN